jgi:aspartate aminotransferase
MTPSRTGAVAAAARALQAKGVDIVDLGLGEPDFATPGFVGAAGAAAIAAGRTKYTDNAGSPDLRDGVAEKYRREQQAAVGRESIVVTAGAKQAVFNACQVLFDPGDEVALFSPYWVSFPEILRLAGAEPVVVRTHLAEGWKPVVERLAAAATDRLRGVVVNSPNNPSGAVVPGTDLERLVEWCAARGIVLIFDETYDRFLYGGRTHVSAARFLASHSPHVVVTGSASKTWAMTGWRLGWALAPKEIAASIASLQGHSTSNASSISQEAALAALRDPAQTDAAVEKMLGEYDRRRRAMRDALQAIDGVRLCDPEGAFYVFPDVSQLYGPLSVAGSVDFCERLLTEAHVAAVPGEAFGVDGCVRFSFATPIDRVEEGMRRLAAWARGAAR